MMTLPIAFSENPQPIVVMAVFKVTVKKRGRRGELGCCIEKIKERREDRWDWGRDTRDKKVNLPLKC